MVDVERLRTERYLGDGLYARFDGGEIWLRAPREHGDHEVALDISTFISLIDYAKELDGTLFPKIAGKREATDG